MNRDDILKEAFLLFSTEGEAFSMRTLAGRLGVKAPAFYNYFESKEQILVLMFREAFDEYSNFFMEAYHKNEKQEPLIQLKLMQEQLFLFFSLKNRAKFWRRIGLLEEKTRQEIVRELAAQEKMIFPILDQLFSKLAVDFGWTKQKKEDVFFSYYLMIQGNIELILMDKPELSRRILQASWNVFEEGLKGNKE